MSTPTGNYYVAAVSMLAIVFGLWLIADSKFGIVLYAIRDDEVAVRASGINTLRYKPAVFAISAAAAGFAGALFAPYLRVAGPSTLEVALSFQVVIWGIFSRPSARAASSVTAPGAASAGCAALRCATCSPANRHTSLVRRVVLSTARKRFGIGFGLPAQPSQWHGACSRWRSPRGAL
jgi:branched-subunit amino acid ABC-type transport system permease component